MFPRFDAYSEVVVNRLRDIKSHETKKLAREEARNVLEAYIYKSRDLVESSNFVEVSTEAERKAIKEKTEYTNEWMGDEGDEADIKELKSKKRDLECVDFLLLSLLSRQLIGIHYA